MKEKLKVHAFGVKVFDGSGDLEDLLTQIENDSLAICNMGQPEAGAFKYS